MQLGMTVRAGAALAGYAALWAAAVAYLAATGGDWGSPVFVMIIFGLAGSGLAWLLTRGVRAGPIAVARPAREGAAMLAFLALYAIGFLGFGMGAARAALPEGPGQEILVLALKLLVHVAAPAMLLALLGARLAPLFQLGLEGRKFWRTLLVLGAGFIGLSCLITPSLANLAASGASAQTLAWAAPAAFVWLALEAGLNEEFLYRAALQTRLSAWFGSAWAGVLATSVLFGLAHAPGLYLRGGPGIDGWSSDPVQVIAFTIATLSPLGLLFGLLYARTKSLLLVVLLHAGLDLLPNLPGFLATWAEL